MLVRSSITTRSACCIFWSYNNGIPETSHVQGWYTRAGRNLADT